MNSLNKMNSQDPDSKSDKNFRDGGYWSQQNYDNSGGESASELLLDYLSVLRQDWWIPLLTVIGAMILAGFSFKFITPEYTAFATLEIKQQESNILGGSIIDEIEANEEFMVTQVALLKSSSLIGEVVEDLRLQDDIYYANQELDREDRVEKAVQSLKQRISINRIRNSRLLQIAMEEQRPEMAAQIPNVLSKNFVRFTQERKYNATAFARNFVRERLDVSRVNLEKSEKNLYEYTQSSGILGGGNIRNDLDASALKTLSTELLSIRTKRLELQNHLDQTDDIYLSDLSERSSLDSLLVELEVEYERKRQTLKHKHPQMISLQAQINSIKDKIKEKEIGERSRQIESMQVDFENAQKLESQYERRVKEVRERMISNQSEDFNYNLLLREVETNRAQYDALLQRFKEISVSDGTGTDLISMVDTAVVPKKPFKPNIPIMLSLAAITGLVLGSGIVILRNILNDVIINPTDVSAKLKLPLIGVIPLSKDKSKEFNIWDELENPLSSVTEGYASARSALENILNSERFVIQVVSARADEGKSSSAIGIAQSFAKSGNPVLLIDADLRKPGFLASKGTAGLSEMLTENANLKNTLLPSGEIDNLTYLPSGKIPDNPAALLSGRYEISQFDCTGERRI